MSAGTGLEQLKWSQLWLPTRRWQRQQWLGECQGDNNLKVAVNTLKVAEVWVPAPCMRRCTSKLSCLQLPLNSWEYDMHIMLVGPPTEKQLRQLWLGACLVRLDLMGLTR